MQTLPPLVRGGGPQSGGRVVNIQKQNLTIGIHILMKMYFASLILAIAKPQNSFFELGFALEFCETMSAKRALLREVAKCDRATARRWVAKQDGRVVI